MIAEGKVVGVPHESVSASVIHADEEPQGIRRHRIVHKNLCFFIWLKAIGSYDSGAFSAALGSGNGISEQWSLSTAQQGSLSSSVFLGNVIGCPLAGHLFSTYNEKQVVWWSLLVHTICTFLFAIESNYTISLILRFFIGLTLSCIVVYTPVWVDEFAPTTKQSVWQAYQNAGVPLGIMLGYMIGAFFPTYTSLSWAYAFIIKVFLMVPTLLYLWKADREFINTKRRISSTSVIVSPVTTEDGSPSGGSAEIPSVVQTRVHHRIQRTASSLRQGFVAGVKSRTKRFWVTVQTLTTNLIYICSTSCMCCLYFAATGLQNFVTQYLRGEPFNASMQTIMLGFGAAVVTAPVIGVIVGGVLLDRIGGYANNFFKTAFFALCCGICGGTIALLCIIVRTAGCFLFLMSILLFFGGTIVPSGIGLTMASLPSAMRSSGAAFSQTVYNLLGNFSGPLICGFVADWSGDLRWGITTVLLVSVLGVVPLGIMVYIGFRDPERLGGAQADGRLPIPQRRSLAKDDGSQEEEDGNLSKRDRLSRTESEALLLGANGAGRPYLMTLASRNERSGPLSERDASLTDAIELSITLPQPIQPLRKEKGKLQHKSPTNLDALPVRECDNVQPSAISASPVTFLVTQNKDPPSLRANTGAASIEFSTFPPARQDEAEPPKAEVETPVQVTRSPLNGSLNRLRVLSHHPSESTEGKPSPMLGRSGTSFEGDRSADVGERIARRSYTEECREDGLRRSQGSLSDWSQAATLPDAVTFGVDVVKTFLASQSRSGSCERSRRSSEDPGETNM